MAKTPLNRLLMIAAACWVLWSLLTWVARPAPPAGVAQAIFLLRMVAALGAACGPACRRSPTSHADGGWPVARWALSPLC